MSVKKVSNENLQKEKKLRFNGMDLFIIILVAAVIIGVIFIKNRASSAGDSDSENEIVTIEYTLEFRKLENSVIGYIGEGDAVKDPDNKQTIGHVISVQSVPYREISYNYDDGGAYMADNPDYSDLLITLRATATKDSGGYYAGGVKFLVGKACNVRSKGFAGSGYCISIKEVDIGA